MRQFDGMSQDKPRELRPRLGKPRGQNRKRPLTTRALVVRAFVEQGGDPRRLFRTQRERKPTGRFNARGRGRQAAAALEGHGGWEVGAGAEPGGAMRYRARRVIVKARVVKLKGVESQAVAAHLRYLQREGVTLDGNRGHAYSATDDQADAKAFGERGREDRHQFRFIVAAEDGVALGDLKPFTRELMEQMEKYLDTALDWVAVDHYNTGHPHTHVVVRGVTDEGKILYIAGNYISHGIRARASDLVTRDLGRQSELEVQQKLTLEVGQERFTRLDRTLLNEAQDGRVDLRISPHQSYLARANRHLLISRLETLEKLELARPEEPGVWLLSPRLQPILTRMGEREDIYTLMRDALGPETVHRGAFTYRVHGEIPSSPVTGHVLGKGLAGDGMGDKAYLVIDGVDAYVHYVELRSTQVPDDVRIGAILTVGREPSARSVDKTIAAYAARNDGFYDPREHLEIARTNARIPGGDVEGHVEAHVRRLEALRRAGIVGRLDANHWDIPRDFLDRAAAYDEREGRKVVIAVHSVVPLDRQIDAEAATWLDRQLVGRHRVETAHLGFGGKVDHALEQRRQQLLSLGLATRREDGGIRYQPELLATLQRRELDRVGERLALKRTDGVNYVPAPDGAVVRGTYRRAITLASGKFAVIQSGDHFTIVQWRDILERFRGREVTGLVRGTGVSWQLVHGLERTRGLSR
jgi:type IV secretory pathway VirD2 relaxase